MKKNNILKIVVIIALCMFINTRDTNALLPPMPFSITVDAPADVTGGVEAGGNTAVKFMEKAQAKYAEVLDKINKFKGKVEDKVNSVVGKAEDKLKAIKDKVSNKVDKIKDKAEDKLDKLADKVDSKKDKLNQKFGRVQEKFNEKLSKFNSKISQIHRKDKGEPTIATSREIAECEIADLDDINSIMEAFDTLFGNYPADLLKKYPQHGTGIRKIYSNKAVEFANDALIELYISSRDLDERMEDLQTEVDGLSEKYVTGETVEEAPEVEGETGEANDNLGSWVNYYNVADIYDSILRISEELSALEAQYEAAMSLQGGVIPKEPKKLKEEGTEEVSFNTYFAEFETSYAQFEVRSDEEKTYINPKWKIVETKPRVAVSPFKGSNEQFKELQDINILSVIANDAIEVHNILQQVTEYKKPYIEYGRMSKLHEKIINNLYDSEKCVIKHLSKYYKDPDELWLGKGCEYRSPGIHCDKNNKLDKADLDVWTSNHVLCGDRLEKVCYAYGLNQYENREGFAGYLISLYKNFKAEKTLNVVEEVQNEETGEIEGNVSIFATQTIDVDAIDSAAEITLTKPSEEEQESHVAMQTSGISDSNYVKFSDEEKMNQNNREQEIITWQIGALAANKLGEDMLKAQSVNSEEHEKISKPYPLWNDEKYFYSTYLENKYKNMRAYITNLDMRKLSLAIAKEINGALFGVQVEDEEPKIEGIPVNIVKSYNSEKIAELEGNIEIVDVLSGASIVQDRLDGEISGLKNDYKYKKNKLQNDIDELTESIDALSIEYERLKTEYNKKAEEKINVKGEEKSDDEIIKNSENNLSAKFLAVKSVKNRRKLKNKIKEIENEMSVLKGQIDDMSSQIANMKDDILTKQDELKVIKNEFVENFAKKEYQKEIEVTKAINEITQLSAPKLSTMVQSDGSVTGKIFKNIIDIADSAARIVRSNAVNAINEGYSDIRDMREKMYDILEYHKIVSIHKDIIKNITEPKVELSSGLLNKYVNIAAIETLAAGLIADELKAVLCQEDKCITTDEEYYVGINPNANDFSAPKEILQSYTPPLREIVHFDGVNYDNLLKSNKLYVSKESLLESISESVSYNQGEVVSYPPIWKLLLSEKGFVERDVPIIPLLMRPELPDIPIHTIEIAHLQTDELIRGGTYPCAYNGYIIDVNNAGFVVQEGGASNCAHIKSIDAKGIKKSFKLDNGDAVPFKKGVGTKGEVSELSLLVYHTEDNRGLKFDVNLSKAIKYLKEVSENDDKDYDKAQKHKSENMVLARNQFGDFLTFVEYETEYQKALNDFEIKLDESRQQLLDVVSAYEEFDIKVLCDVEMAAKVKTSEDADIESVCRSRPYLMKFDLANADTYKAFIKELNKVKENRIKDVENGLEKLKGSNEALTESIDYIKNTLELLKKDKDELVNISEGMSLKELETNIKRSQADKDAQDEYEKEVEKSYKEKEDGIITPYCAIYE